MGERFWLRPKWVVGHVLAVVLVVLFVALGFWQLRRLDERQDRNAEIEARSALPVAPVEEVVEGTPVDRLPYRRATAEGTYDAAAQVLVRNRSLDGIAGRHVLTPLVLADGTAVAVNRGFVPNGVEPPAPPPGEVAARGLLLATQERGSFGPTDPAEGVLAELARADLGRLQQQYDRALLPAYLQLEGQEPQPGQLPRLLEPPDTGEGPHLGYAVQWFLFAAVGAVGWPLLLRRTAAGAPA